MVNGSGLTSKIGDKKDENQEGSIDIKFEGKNDVQKKITKKTAKARNLTLLKKTTKEILS